MLDRLISGAGAVTDAADRSVRLLASGSSRGIGTTRPGSVVVAAILLVAGEPARARRPRGDRRAVRPRRSTRPMSRSLATSGTGRMPRSAAPCMPPRSRRMTTSTATASRMPTRTSTRGTTGSSTAADRSGVTVRSKRPPSELFTFSARGYVLSGEPRFLTSDRSDLEAEAKAAGLTYDSKIVIDTVRRAPATAKPFDLAGRDPGRVPTRSSCRDRGWAHGSGCAPDREPTTTSAIPPRRTRYEILVFEPVSRHAVRVLVAELPEFSDATITGLLRREERAVDDARNIVGLDFDELRSRRLATATSSTTAAGRRARHSPSWPPRSSSSSPGSSSSGWPVAT